MVAGKGLAQDHRPPLIVHGSAFSAPLHHPLPSRKSRVDRQYRFNCGPFRLTHNALNMQAHHNAYCSMKNPAIHFRARCVHLSMSTKVSMLFFFSSYLARRDGERRKEKSVDNGHAGLRDDLNTTIRCRNNKTRVNTRTDDIDMGLALLSTTSLLAQETVHTSLRPPQLNLHNRTPRNSIAQTLCTKKPSVLMAI
jgi:hypothetical protein